MLANIFIFIVIIASAAFQVSFLTHIFSAENVPDFLLIIVIFWSIRRKIPEILLWVVLSGIVLDTAYLAPFGLNALSFVFIAFSLNYLIKKVLVMHETFKFLITLGLVILGTILNDWILAVFGKIIAEGSLDYTFTLFLSQGIFLKVLYNSIILILIYWPLTKIESSEIFHNYKIKPIK